MGELSLSARLSVFDAAQWAETLSPEPELRAQYGLCVQRLPGAVVCRCAATPISFFNKAFLDPTSPGGDAALLDAIAACYDGDPYKVIWTPTCGEGLRAALQARGLKRTVPYAVMACDLATDSDPPDDPPLPRELTIRELAPAEWELGDDIALRGFGGATPAPFAALGRSFGQRHPAARHRFLAFWEGQPAAHGMLLLLGGVVGLYGGATLPEFRGNGIQQALIRHRRRLARLAGAALLCGGASPSSTSQRNLERQGLHFIHDSEQYEWTP